MHKYKCYTFISSSIINEEPLSNIHYMQMIIGKIIDKPYLEMFKPNMEMHIFMIFIHI